MQEDDDVLLTILNIHRARFEHSSEKIQSERANGWNNADSGARIDEDKMIIPPGMSCGHGSNDLGNNLPPQSKCSFQANNSLFKLLSTKTYNHNKDSHNHRSMLCALPSTPSVPATAIVIPAHSDVLFGTIKGHKSNPLRLPHTPPWGSKLKHIASRVPDWS